MPAANSATIQTHTIKWLYILALSIVAMLTTTGQVLVQWSLSALQGDSTTVNVAGRQRMLSQRIPRIILALDANRRSPQTAIESGVRSEESNQQQPPQPIADLRDSISVWRTNHLALENASTAVGLSRPNSQPVYELFAKVEPDFGRVVEIAESVIKRYSSANVELLDGQERTALLKHSDAFLSSMDAIVTQYEREAKQRVGRLQWIERGLLIATLLVLVCEGLFIFSPAIASLNRAFQRLRVVTEQLELAKETAEKANRAKTQFLARVSHELRTPLHAILGMLGLIRQGRLTHGQKRRADLAYNAARTLRHLVDDLLDLASAESGSALTLNLEATDVAKVVNDCVNLMSQHAIRKRLKLQVINDFPSGNVCMLDEYRLRQILINLIQNAIRYTSRGEIECRTWLEQNVAPHRATSTAWLNIAVRDTGCGIAPENLNRIFENFVRINPRDEPQVIGVRLGLGLPITASLVKTMRGTINVESKLGEGSVFSIRLPTVVNELAASTIAQSKKAARISSTKARRHDATNSIVTALVVDDSKVNRLLLRDYLKRLGLRVCSTNSLVRALSLFEERYPRLVFLDLHVGRQRSLGLAHSIRTLPGGSTALIYFITADGHFTDESCPAEIDVAGILNKPIELDELYAKLKPVLRSLDRGQTLATASSNEFDELRSQLRRLLADQLPSELLRLNEAFASQDFKTIQLIAHRLRGSASNAGWTELAEATAKLENHPTFFHEFMASFS